MALADTVEVEVTVSTTWWNACLGYDYATGRLVCVAELPVTAGQRMEIDKGYARVVVPRYARLIQPEPEPETPVVEVHERPSDAAPRPMYRPPSRVGMPKPAMDRSRIARRPPGACGRDVWNTKAGQYEPCAQKRHHRDQCRSQAQIDARTEAQRERRRKARE